MKYTGPAKPIPTTHHRMRIEYIEALVYTVAIIVLALDLFVWRP